MDRLIATNSVAVGDTAPATGTPQFATSGNPATNTPATDFPAYQYNALQEELMAILAAGNIAADRTKTNQVMTAVLTLLGLGNYVADTGAAGAIAIAPANPVALTAGMKVRIKVAATNPGAATLAYNAGAAIPIVGAGGALQGGELQGGYLYDFVYLPGATNYWLLIGSTKGPLSVAPATAAGHAVQLAQSFAGATPQDVTASRALGTTYTNSTSRTILVTVISLTSSTSQATQQAAVAGINLFGSSFAGGTSTAIFITFAVAPGETYSASISGAGGASLYRWLEHR